MIEFLDYHARDDVSDDNSYPTKTMTDARILFKSFRLSRTVGFGKRNSRKTPRHSSARAERRSTAASWAKWT
jgi:hypothetical protein